MLNLARIQARMAQLNNWNLDGEMIVKEFNFMSFGEAMEFVNDVAEIAEKAQHHPSIIIDGSMVRLSLTTHKERCLTDLDFDVAMEIDKVQ
jgi:4a-hydroxytetrahydrobiopterin dehydratase